MSASYEEIRNTYYIRKRKENGGKLSKKEKQNCQEMAAKWYVKKYGKSVKHASKDYIVVGSDDVLLKDIAKPLMQLNYDIIIPVENMDLDKMEIEAGHGIARATTFLVEDLKMGNSIEDIGLSRADVEEQIELSRIIDYDTENDKIPERTIDDFIPNEEEAKQKDLMYVSFKLVHASGNKNKDFFLEEELEKAQFTPILKPLNWQHGEPNIGTIYLSKYVAATDDEPAYIKCAVAIYKYKYMDYAQEMMDRYNNDNLFFSMEVWFTEFECSTCKTVYKFSDYEVCSHLQERFNEGNNTFRILHNLTFAGAGVVDNPADILADSISVASKQNQIYEEDKNDNRNNNDSREGVSNNMSKTVIEKSYTDEDIKAMIDEKLGPLTTDLEKASEALKTVTSERDTAVAETKELKAIVEEKDKKLEETVASMDELRTEFDAFKKEIADEKNLADRLAELTSLDINLPDDDEEAKAFVEKIKTIDDDAFDLIKKTLALKVKEKVSDDSKADDNKSDNDSVDKKDKDSSKANDNDSGKADIPVGAKASASSNRLSDIQNTIRKTIRGD